jgi:hypothetical protein
LRDGALILNPEIGSALLATVDSIRQMLASISNTGQDGAEAFADLIERLQQLQSTTPLTPSADPASSVAAKPATVPIPPVPSAERVPPAPSSTAGEKEKKFQPHAGKIGGALIEHKRIKPEGLTRALEAQGQAMRAPSERSSSPPAWSPLPKSPKR